MNEQRKHPGIIGEIVNGKTISREMTEEEETQAVKRCEEMDYRYGRSKRAVKSLIESGVLRATPEILEAYSKLTFPPSSEDKQTTQ